MRGYCILPGTAAFVGHSNPLSLHDSGERSDVLRVSKPSGLLNGPSGEPLGKVDQSRRSQDKKQVLTLGLGVRRNARFPNPGTRNASRTHGKASSAPSWR